MWVAWQLASQNVGGNFSTINWQSYFRFGGGDTQLDNGGVYSNIGTLWANGGRVYNYSGNFSVRDMLLASGTNNIGHNGDGTQVWQMGVGITTRFSPSRSAGTSGVWSLTTIPRASQPSLGANPTQIGNDMVINMNRLSGGFTHTVEAYFGAWSATLATGVATQYTWNTNTNAGSLYSQIPNANSGNGTIRVHTYSGGSHIGQKDVGFTVTVNTTTNAPTFTAYDTVDSNATTVAITGDSSVLIQNQSTARTTIPVANKMIPKNSSTAVRYESTLNGATINGTFSNIADVVINHGVVNATTALTQGVKAVDSRGNNTTVNKSITVVPYAQPIVSASATRLNGFENDTTLVVSGSFAPITVGGVDKNTILSTDVQFRHKLQGGAWSSWINMTRTLGSGTFTTTNVPLSFDKSMYVDFEVRATDKLYTTTNAFRMSAGKPIFYVDAKRNSVGVGHIPAYDNALDVDGKVYSKGVVSTGVVDFSGADSVIFPTDTSDTAILLFATPSTGSVTAPSEFFMEYNAIDASPNCTMERVSNSIKINVTGYYTVNANLRCIDAPQFAHHRIDVSIDNGATWVAFTLWSNGFTPENTGRNYPARLMTGKLNAGDLIKHRVSQGGGKTRWGGTNDRIGKYNTSLSATRLR